MTHKRDGVSFSEARVHLFPESPEVVAENYNVLVGYQREPLLPEILQYLADERPLDVAITWMAQLELAHAGVLPPLEKDPAEDPFRVLAKGNPSDLLMPSDHTRELRNIRRTAALGTTVRRMLFKTPLSVEMVWGDEDPDMGESAHEIYAIARNYFETGNRTVWSESRRAVQSGGGNVIEKRLVCDAINAYAYSNLIHTPGAVRSSIGDYYDHIRALAVFHTWHTRRRQEATDTVVAHAAHAYGHNLDHPAIAALEAAVLLTEVDLHKELGQLPPEYPNHDPINAGRDRRLVNVYNSTHIQTKRFLETPQAVKEAFGRERKRAALEQRGSGE